MDGSLLARIAEARNTLVRAGLSTETAAFDAELLARHALGWDRAQLLARNREPPPEGFQSVFDRLVARRAAREPAALILGEREFWGLSFEVTADTLIPRPETELIVEEALAWFTGRNPGIVIDVGTGSGCLAVSLAREFPHARVIATDVSEGALVVAERNAVRHGVSDRIAFVRTNLLTDIDTQADLIVSNPPYVSDAAAAQLPPEVVRYEPRTALFAGDDGLSVMRELLSAAPGHLAPGGLLVVEFGFGQEADVRALAAAADWNVVRVRHDLQDIPRTIVLRR
jgi:release factor glutamine methyltransferase